MPDPMNRTAQSQQLRLLQHLADMQATFAQFQQAVVAEQIDDDRIIQLVKQLQDGTQVTAAYVSNWQYPRFAGRLRAMGCQDSRSDVG